MTLIQSKRALLWLFNIAGNNVTYLSLHVKCLIRTKFRISRKIFTEVTILIFMEIRSMGALLIHTECQKDRETGG